MTNNDNQIALGLHDDIYFARPIANALTGFNGVETEIANHCPQILQMHIERFRHVTENTAVNDALLVAGILTLGLVREKGGSGK